MRASLLTFDIPNKGGSDVWGKQEVRRKAVKGEARKVQYMDEVRTD